MEETRQIASNRRASFEYEILETFEAGLVLTGTEIKSLRLQNVSIQEAYIRVIKDEVWLIGATIPPYKLGNIYNHQEKRDRKLLLHQKEIRQLKGSTQEKGLTIIPLSLFLKKGWAKLKIGIARGKKLHDKRAAIKERDDKREQAKAMKNAVR